jgi:hypothetical protein
MKKKRRPREFTTPESLAYHPINNLFRNPKAVKIISERGEEGFSFADLRYLLSEDRPSFPMKKCPKHGDCTKCKKAELCSQKILKEWVKIFSMDELQGLTIYRNRSNLVADLDRLRLEGYIVKMGKRYCENRRIPENVNPGQVSSEYLKKLLRNCPRDFSWYNEIAHFLYLERTTAEECVDDFQLLYAFIQSINVILGKIVMRTWLRDIGALFETELSELESDRVKLHLRKHLRSYVERKLTSWNVNKGDFKTELKEIFEKDLGIGKRKATKTEKEIEKADEIAMKAIREMSEAIGIVPSTKSWSRLYPSIIPRKKGERKKEVERIKKILNEEQEFLKYFNPLTDKWSPLRITLDPVVIIQYPKVAIPCYEPHS